MRKESVETLTLTGPTEIPGENFDNYALVRFQKDVIG